MNGLQQLIDILVTRPVIVAGVTGLLSTLITSIATQRSWSSSAKRWFALGVVLVLTALGIVLTLRPIDWAQVAAQYAMAAGAAQTAYTVLQALGISGWLTDHTATRAERALRAADTEPGRSV